MSLDLTKIPTRQLLRMRWTYRYYGEEHDLDENQIYAELAKREHVPNKSERKIIMHKKHDNGPEHEKKKMLFHRDGRHKENPDAKRQQRWEEYVKLQLEHNR